MFPHQVDDLKRVTQINDELAALERIGPQTRGEPFASPVEWTVPWDGSAAMPTLISTETAAVLLYRPATPQSQRWPVRAEDFAIIPVDHGSVAIWIARPCICSGLTRATEQILDAHPYRGRGLQEGRAHTIGNSPWLRELVEQDNSLSLYDRSDLSSYQHLLIWFRDLIVELVVRSWHFEGFALNSREAFIRANELLTRD